MIHGPAVNSLTKMIFRIMECSKKYRRRLWKVLCALSSKKFEVDGYVTPYGDSPLDDENVGENVYLNMINQAYDYFIYYNTLFDLRW